MKNFSKLIRYRGLFLAAILIAPSAFGIPTVRLEAPSTVNVGELFTVSVFVDGVQSPDTLLAFGFNLGYQSDVVSFDGFTVAAPFSDDTPLRGGPFAGSVFPGLQGDNILLGQLAFTAIGSGALSLDVGDQNDAPLTTGLFTALNPDRYRIQAYASVDVVPDASPTIGLLALSLAGLVVAGKGITRY